MKLTPADHAFLKNKSATIVDLCDARHLKTKEEKYEYIKSKGKRFGYGDPCTNGGHRVKHRSGGHCGPCKPDADVYSFRYSKESFVYIAGSLTKQYMKIGISKDPTERVQKLRWMPYAGVSDWELLFHMKTPESGRVEHEAIAHLEKSCLRLGYIKDGRKQEAIEVVSCSYGIALEAVVRVTTTYTSEPWQSDRRHLYKFK